MNQLLQAILKVTDAGRTVTFRKDPFDDVEVLIHDHGKNLRTDFTVRLNATAESEKNLADLIETSNMKLNYLK